MLSFQCLPILKEEVEDNGRPSFVNSQRGWFAFSALGISAKTSVPVVSRTALSPLIKDNANVDSIHQTCFSDAVAVEVYRITFLLLKFLCMQAMAASKRAEDVEFIDLAHFPELPMPEILHGIQDQATCIVTEVCAANKSKTIQHETQDVCVLLLQILEMSLYIEFCVSQICGIRPVSGRIEDFSKEIKQLMQATEGHKFLESSLRSLKQLLVLVYPGLVQVEGIF
ncbi:hypothetical protein QJS10_CPA03g02213 [Acorus calamus]|uniref:Uncharacterized protein n=1 Tax=Acorus calamus TaxID=4465 RepID=A0AAV9F6T0_ACOCL|nr:hypothetical protein QJS10_CPA03g02213 [Acorus calamus]